MFAVNNFEGPFSLAKRQCKGITRHAARAILSKMHFKS